MKIAQVSTYDTQGGAARAAYRLHKGLLLIGQESTLLSKYQASSDPNVRQIIPLTGADLLQENSFSTIQSQYINRNRTQLSNTLFSLPYPGVNLSQLQPVVAADIINLHWVADFQSPVTLKKLFGLGKPVIWTLHDMWPFTGGCHYSAGCDKYQQNCSACPQLVDDPFDLAAVLLKDKLECFAEAELTIVTPSRWLADCAKQSQLFKSYRIEVIPYSLETHDLFTPLNKTTAKQTLGIAPETITLLFGAGTAVEARKGFAELVQATHCCLENPQFRQLAAQGQIEILCFGHPSELLSAIEIPVRSLGEIESDYRLKQIYSAADLFILPSLEDNLPNTMMEAMSCGTPVIGFAVGGIPDLVEDQVTGRTVPVGETQKLAEAILNCIFDPALRQQMGQQSRQVMEQYPLEKQAQRYLDLYQDLLKTQAVSSSISPSTLDAALAVPLETKVGRHLAPVLGQLSLHAFMAKIQQIEAESEAQTQNLQAIADQRLSLINELEQTAEERLVLIDQLNQTAREHITQIDQLTQITTERQQLIEQLETSLQQQTESLEQINRQLQHQLDQAHQKVERLQQKVGRSQQRNKQLQQRIQAAEQQIVQLEERVNVLASGKGALKTLWRQIQNKARLFGQN